MRVLKNRIAEFRKRKYLNQEQLAELLNTRSRTIRRWESGECYPTADIVLDLMNVLDCDIKDLFYYGEE